MGELSPWHLAIVAIVLLLLFGSARLPDAARSLGQSLRIFRHELRARDSDEPQPPAAKDASGPE